jgi:cellulose synthase/poly-beta-1,6-N-acetylglucosamine synthase-like glycosyltransferase
VLLLYTIEFLLLGYFSYVALYTLVFGIAGKFYRPITPLDNEQGAKFCVFIPAYKEDGVILKVAQQALIQDYPTSHFDIVVIADSLKKETIEKLNALPIIVCEVSFEKSTKVKALNQALKNYESQYSHAVILDADNVMAPDFLSNMNALHNLGYAAIQGRRAAKNEENNLAFLDGLSEEINNHFLGKGSAALGLSSSLKGSGMSFEINMVSTLLKDMDSVGGFDRELEVKLVQAGTKVLYADNVVVYDEKVTQSEVFENQRKRWISSQYIYLKKYFWAGTSALFLKGNITYYNSAVLRNIQLPRLINIGLIFIFTALAILLRDVLYIHYLIWPILLGSTYLGIALSIPREYFGLKLLKAIARLPLVFLRMLKIVLKLKGANKKFIHTPHGSD